MAEIDFVQASLRAPPRLSWASRPSADDTWPKLAERGLAKIYAVAATVFMLLLAVIWPPIQGADEGAHLVRADQISHGEFVAYKFAPGATGGVIDLGVMQAIQRFYPILLDQGARVSRPLYAPIAWGAAGKWSFPNTALYPPIFYVPASAAIFAGRRIGLDVLHTATLARIATGLASIATASLAIAFSGPAAIWLFALLLLPSSVALMSSITQDGPMLASAALAMSLMMQLRRQPTAAPHAKLSIACALITLLGMSRPPYAALALLPLVSEAHSPGVKRIAVVVVLATTFAWWGFCALNVLVNVDPTHAADPGTQLAALLSHPWRLPGLIGTTLRLHWLTDYAGLFITNITMPTLFHVLAWCMLALAATATAFSGVGWDRRAALLVLLGIASAVAGLFAIQYITWTPVGAPDIRGVLGRYFLPLAAFLPLILARETGRQRGWSAWLFAPVMAFPMLSLVLSVHALILRYYF